MTDDAEPTEEQRDAAALWLSKRVGKSLTSAEAEDMEQWLNADRRHRLAFDQVRVVWAQLEKPAIRMASIGKEPVLARRANKAAHRYIPSLAVIAMSFTACLGLWIVDPTILQDWQADVVSGQGAVTDVTLPDGSLVRLGAGTALNIDFSKSRRYVQLLRGEAFFDVHHDSRAPFFVDSLGNQVRVVGTRFNVDQLQDRTTVSVEEGAVQVTGEEGSGARLSPGQQVVVTGGRAGPVETADMETALSWMKGRLSANNILVRDLVATLQRHSQGRIFVRETIANRRISGTFPTTDVPASLETIAAATNGSIVRASRLVSILY